VGADADDRATAGALGDDQRIGRGTLHDRVGDVSRTAAPLADDRASIYLWRSVLLREVRYRPE